MTGYNPYEVVWDNTLREDLDRAPMFLLAVMLFDIGRRIGICGTRESLTRQKIPGRERTPQIQDRESPTDTPRS
jgi:hypothetical protein